MHLVHIFECLRGDQVKNSSFHWTCLSYKSFYFIVRIRYLLVDQEVFTSPIDSKHFFVVYLSLRLTFLQSMDCIKADCHFSSFDWNKHQHVPEKHACYYEVTYVHSQNLIDFSHVNVFWVDLIVIAHWIALLVTTLHMLYRFFYFLVGVEYHKCAKSEVIQICLEGPTLVFYRACNHVNHHSKQEDCYFCPISFACQKVPFFNVIL